MRHTSISGCPGLKPTCFVNLEIFFFFFLQPLEIFDDGITDWHNVEIRLDVIMLM